MLIEIEGLFKCIIFFKICLLQTANLLFKLQMFLFKGILLAKKGSIQSQLHTTEELWYEKFNFFIIYVYMLSLQRQTIAHVKTL